MAQEQLGLPFVRGVIKNLVIDLFKRPEPWVRADLVKEALKKHLELGGIPGNQDPTSVIKATLKILKDENRIKAVDLGIWKRIDLDSPEAQQKEEVIHSPEIIQEIQEIKENSKIDLGIENIPDISEVISLDNSLDHSLDHPSMFPQFPVLFP